MKFCSTAVFVMYFVTCFPSAEALDRFGNLQYLLDLNISKCTRNSEGSDCESTGQITLDLTCDNPSSLVSCSRKWVNASGADNLFFITVSLYFQRMYSKTSDNFSNVAWLIIEPGNDMQGTSAMIYLNKDGTINNSVTLLGNTYHISSSMQDTSYQARVQIRTN